MLLRLFLVILEKYFVYNDIFIEGINEPFLWYIIFSTSWRNSVDFRVTVAYNERKLLAPKWNFMWNRKNGNNVGNRSSCR